MNYQALLIILSSISLALLVVPFAVQFKNVHRFPFLSFLCWLIIQLLQNIINASIWGALDFATRWPRGVGYCDLMVYINDPTMTGLVCSVAGILFFLFSTLNTGQFLGYSLARQNLIYAAICWASPVVIVSFSYLVRAQRFAIARYDGCSSVLDINGFTFVLICVIPLIWVLVDIVLAGLTIFMYFKRRKDVKDILKTTQRGISVAKFARTLGFCVTIILLEIPLIIIYIYNNTGSFHAYNYTAIHSPVAWDVIPTFDIDQPTHTRWVYCAVGFLTFFIFGLGENSRVVYRNILAAVGLGSLLTSKTYNVDSDSDMEVKTGYYAEGDIFEDSKDEEAKVARFPAELQGYQCANNKSE